MELRNLKERMAGSRKDPEQGSIDPKSWGVLKNRREEYDMFSLRELFISATLLYLLFTVVSTMMLSWSFMYYQITVLLSPWTLLFRPMVIKRKGRCGVAVLKWFAVCSVLSFPVFWGFINTRVSPPTGLKIIHSADGEGRSHGFKGTGLEWQKNEIEKLSAPCASVLTKDHGLIDVVYTWVNVTDPAYQKRAAQHGCPVSDDVGGGGNSDPSELLQYSLRSIFKYCRTFIRKIIIITPRPLRPSWLRESSHVAHYGYPTVEVWHHDEFMPEELLPAFSSYSVEVSLSRLHAAGIVKNECFVYMNDDSIIAKHQYLADFLSGIGRMQLTAFSHLKLLGESCFTDRPYGISHISEDPAATMNAHIPLVVHSESWAKSNRQWNEAAYQTNCFHTSESPVKTYQRYQVSHPELVQYSSPWDTIRCLFTIGNMSYQFTKFWMWILEPKWVYVKSSPSQDAVVKDYLESEFGRKVRWEVGSTE